MICIYYFSRALIAFCSLTWFALLSTYVYITTCIAYRSYTLLSIQSLLDAYSPIYIAIHTIGTKCKYPLSILTASLTPCTTTYDWNTSVYSNCLLSHCKTRAWSRTLPPQAHRSMDPPPSGWMLAPTWRQCPPSHRPTATNRWESDPYPLVGCGPNLADTIDERIENCTAKMQWQDLEAEKPLSVTWSATHKG